MGQVETVSPEVKDLFFKVDPEELSPNQTVLGFVLNSLQMAVEGISLPGEDGGPLETKIVQNKTVWGRINDLQQTIGVRDPAYLVSLMEQDLSPKVYGKKVAEIEATLRVLPEKISCLFSSLKELCGESIEVNLLSIPARDPLIPIDIAILEKAGATVTYPSGDS
jgi:hypothetical protein